jgi:large subunit ribosomal protein L14
MLQLNSKVKVLDNSGATKARVIKILNKKKIGKVGSLVLLSIVRNLRGSKIRKGSVQKGVIVRTNKDIKGFNCRSN